MAAGDSTDPNDGESTDTGNELLSQPNGGVKGERPRAGDHEMPCFAAE